MIVLMHVDPARSRSLFAELIDGCAITRSGTAPEGVEYVIAADAWCSVVGYTGHDLARVGELAPAGVRWVAEVVRQLPLHAHLLRITEAWTTHGGTHWAAGWYQDRPVLLYSGRRGQWMAHTCGWHPPIGIVDHSTIYTTLAEAPPVLGGLEGLPVEVVALERPLGWRSPAERDAAA